MYPTASTEQQSISPSVQCKPWEKSSRGKCVCKMPFECGYVYSANHQCGHMTFCKLDWFDWIAYSCGYCFLWWFLFFVTSPSLEMCAMSPVSRKSALLNVCKMHVLQCMRKDHMIAEDSTCKWPERNTTGCTNCHMWETCDGRDIQGYKQSLVTYSICKL